MSSSFRAAKVKWVTFFTSGDVAPWHFHGIIKLGAELQENLEAEKRENIPPQLPERNDRGWKSAFDFCRQKTLCWCPTCGCDPWNAFSTCTKPAPFTQRCSATSVENKRRPRRAVEADFCLASIVSFFLPARKLNHTCCHCLYQRWYSINAAAVAKNLLFLFFYQSEISERCLEIHKPICFQLIERFSMEGGEKGSSLCQEFGCNHYCTCSFVSLRSFFTGGKKVLCVFYSFNKHKHK